jgi:hypothetical protein
MPRTRNRSTNDHIEPCPTRNVIGMIPTPFQAQLHYEASQALEKKGIPFESYAKEQALVVTFESVILTILENSAHFTSAVLKHDLERKDYQNIEALIAEAAAYLERLTFKSPGWR